MARKHKRRHYGSVVSMNLNGLPSFGKQVKSTDVYAGVAAGLAGVGVVKYLVNNVLSPTLVPAALQKFVPLIAGGLTGAALYFVQKKSPRAAGHMVGAVATGAAITAMDFMRSKVPGLAAIDTLRLGEDYDGLLVNDRGMNGLLVADNQRLNGYADNPELEELASMDAYGSEDALELSAP